MTGPRAARPFPRERLAGDEAASGARALLGALLVREDARGRRVGRIVEVEAYGGAEDAASHARARSGSRRIAMAAAPGSAYVYRVYGMHHCLNVVTGPVGAPSAVLIRAVHPLDGIGAIRAARRGGLADGGRTAERIARLPDVRIAAGPALVAAAFDVDASWTGADLCAPETPLRLEADAPPVPDNGIVSGPRIGVAYAGEPWASAPLRFGLRGDPSLSRPFP